MLDDFLETQYRGDKETSMESILIDVKTKIGPSADYEEFDTDIIDAINTCFGILTQLGVGPKGGFAITDATTVWSQYTTELTVLNLVRSYIYKKTILLFDPPASSYLVTQVEEQIKELEWRLNVEVDPKGGDEVVEELP